jgi:hypothetical protein
MTATGGGGAAAAAPAAGGAAPAAAAKEEKKEEPSEEDEVRIALSTPACSHLCLCLRSGRHCWCAPCLNCPRPLLAARHHRHLCRTWASPSSTECYTHVVRKIGTSVVDAVQAAPLGARCLHVLCLLTVTTDVPAQQTGTLRDKRYRPCKKIVLQQQRTHALRLQHTASQIKAQGGGTPTSKSAQAGVRNTWWLLHELACAGARSSLSLMMPMTSDCRHPLVHTTQG